jgi:hypothetical protein
MLSNMKSKREETENPLLSSYVSARGMGRLSMRSRRTEPYRSNMPKLFCVELQRDSLARDRSQSKQHYLGPP